MNEQKFVYVVMMQFWAYDEWSEPILWSVHATKVSAQKAVQEQHIKKYDIIICPLHN